MLWAGGQVLLSGARRRTMFERFTDRARRVVVLAQEEARMLNHNYIGTEHILLGLVREGDGVALQVLVLLGADLNRVRQQVIRLLHEHPAEEPGPARSAGQNLRVSPAVQTRLEAVERRLVAIEQRIGTGPDTGDPALPDLAERCEQLTDETERLRALLRQHGIDPQDRPA
jgi:hypothetical protein